jgi:HTH-type transcriptional regulator / antitoxin HigA
MNARLDAALAHWVYIAPLLTPPVTDAEYQALVESLNAVLDAGGADEAHSLAGLAVMLGDLVSAYEQAHYAMPPAMNGAEVLQFLMERDGLRQSDLPEIGNQAKVSEILSGKRNINLRQARALAARFGVPLALLAA